MNAKREEENHKYKYLINKRKREKKTPRSCYLSKKLAQVERERGQYQAVSTKTKRDFSSSSPLCFISVGHDSRWEKKKKKKKSERLVNRFFLFWNLCHTSIVVG